MSTMPIGDDECLIAAQLMPKTVLSCSGRNLSGNASCLHLCSLNGVPIVVEVNMTMDSFVAVIEPVTAIGSVVVEIYDF